MNEIITFKGKPITECSREELIESIEWCMKELDKEKKLHKGSIEMLQASIKFKD